jgi:hypothetical protein
MRGALPQFTLYALMILGQLRLSRYLVAYLFNYTLLPDAVSDVVLHAVE